MNSFIRRVDLAVGRAVTAVAYAAGVILLLLMALTVADVGGRYFFNSPIIGVFDLTHFAVLLMTFFGMGYCAYLGGHVAIDLVYDRLPPRAAIWVDRLVNATGSLFFLVMGWRLVVQSVDVRDFGESSQLLQIPFFPFYWLAALGSVLFALVMALRIFVPQPKRKNSL